MLQQQDILGVSQLNTSKQVAKSIFNSMIADSEVTWLADFFLSLLINNISKKDANIAFMLAVTSDAASPAGASAHHVKQCWLKAKIFLQSASQMKMQNSLN